MVATTESRQVIRLYKCPQATEEEFNRGVIGNCESCEHLRANAALPQEEQKALGDHFLMDVKFGQNEYLSITPEDYTTLLCDECHTAWEKGQIAFQITPWDSWSGQ